MYSNQSGKRHQGTLGSMAVAIVAATFFTHPFQTVAQPEVHNDETERNAAELLLKAQQRFEDLRRIDITVRCSFGLLTQENPRVQRFRFLKDGDKWAHKWIHSDPVPPPTNYRIGRPEGQYTFYHTPPGGRVRHSLNIEDPTEYESRNQVSTLCANLGALWYKRTRQYVQREAHRARLVGREQIDGANCAIVELDVPPDELFEALHAVQSRALLKQGAVLRVYVAPEWGFAIPRYEYRAVDGSPDVEFTCSGFEQYGEGFYFPSQGVMYSLEPTPEGGFKRLYFMRNEITEVGSVNEPVPDGEFEIVVPPGTSVIDSRAVRGRKVIVDET